MKKRQIVNIVNFIRGAEPRRPINLVEPVEEQIRLMKEHNLRGTFLLQYDALIQPVYQEILLALDPKQFEIGVWLEMNSDHAAAAGIPWRGRYSWDWHAHCGFSVGYTKEEREKLVDAIFSKFKEIFGYYPRVLGSWFYETHTIRYACDRYGLDAICNCKEQYGTDGYTLWGGFYGQAYYPSRTNVFMPAQTEEGQLPVPLFRMLGSDPVYQYDYGTDPCAGANKIQGVITLEPYFLHKGGGGDPEWVDWFMRENFNGDCLSFGYVQAGQENSFGWPGMKVGITHQFAEFDRLQREGKLIAEPIGDTGRWFKNTYALTPPSAITAHTAYDDPDRQSVWYGSRWYRANLYSDHGALRIRDLHVFREDHPDPYEEEVCTGNSASYETLPVIDGNRHTGNGIVAGMYPVYENGEEVRGELLYEEREGNAVLSCGDMQFVLREEGITVTAKTPFSLIMRRGKTDDHMPEVISLADKKLNLCYDGTEYCVRLTMGSFEDANTVHSENNTVQILFSH